ncbi:hypothetical protein [Gemella cuniculi]|uniref:hypothetical protein n=1 Tax=Gemella cuniculi TaxID=150240 RepID=UPI0003F62213|nr:hypothetical protein [Gemella cuniculi]
MLIELESRILHINYKYPLSELEDKIGKLPNEEIINYSSEILKALDNQNQYLERINNIISDNNIQIESNKRIIERIQKYREDNTLRKLEGYKELKTASSKRKN